MNSIINDLIPPYFFTQDELPGLDFNREIIEPGTNEEFPNGAIGIRADDDFWGVAALPLSYRDTPLAEIVKELWPQYAASAKLCPDSGTVEQKIYFSTRYAKNVEKLNKHLNKTIRDQQKQIARLRNGRTDLHEHHVERKYAESSYFIRQYEHLLVAMAHEADPRQDLPGICSKCGLYTSDRVHDKFYLNKHNKGYTPSMRHLLEYSDGNDDED